MVKIFFKILLTSSFEVTTNAVFIDIWQCPKHAIFNYAD